MIKTDSQKLNIILFCDCPPRESNAGTLVDHISAFSKYSQHNIFCFSNLGAYPKRLDLNKFDVLIIHYSSSLLNNRYISLEGQQRIKEFKGLKILFVQDEYRRVHHFHQKISELGIHVLFTCIPEEEIERIYPSELLPNLIKINNLTGYVPEYLLHLNPPPIKNRSIDMGYRARKLPFWYGRLAVEKWKIVDDFLAHTHKTGLHCDLSYEENKRIYGGKWLKFVQNCRTMLGVESGASVIDFTGALEREVEVYQAKHPNCTFEEIYEKYLKDHEGKVYMNQISPRCFEAIALKTPLVLFEGKYSNILVPERHYISLKKDFSNIDKVVAHIKDTDYLQQLAECAYQEVALNPCYSYKNFIERFDEIVSDAFIEKKFFEVKETYDQRVFLKHSRPSFYNRLKVQVFKRLRWVYRKLPNKLQYRIRMLYLNFSK